MSLVNHEVLEVPEQNQRSFQLVQMFRQNAVAFSVKVIPAGGFQNQGRFASVPRDAAFRTEVFKRLIPSVIGKNHPQRRGAALRRLHLKHGRSFLSCRTQKRGNHSG